MWNQIYPEDDPVRSNSVFGHLRPRPGCITEIHDRRSAGEDSVCFVHLEELESRARFEALKLGFTDKMVAPLP